MNEGRLAKPIYKPCPRCNVLTQWYWTYEENEFERSLKAVECSCEIDPLELGFESYEAWKMDPNNFYQQPSEKVASTTEEELLATVPPSRRVSRSSTES
jgi:hypothetical protein